MVRVNATMGVPTKVSARGPKCSMAAARELAAGHSKQIGAGACLLWCPAVIRASCAGPGFAAPAYVAWAGFTTTWVERGTQSP